MGRPTCGSSDLWIVGLVDRRTCGSSDLWVVELVGRRTCGSSDLWIVGLVGRRTCGSSDCVGRHRENICFFLKQDNAKMSGVIANVSVLVIINQDTIRMLLPLRRILST